MHGKVVTMYSSQKLYHTLLQSQLISLNEKVNIKNTVFCTLHTLSENTSYVYNMNADNYNI